MVVTVGISSQHAQLPGTCGHVSLFRIKWTKCQLLGNDYPEESPHFPWFFMAHVRRELSNTLKICIALCTEFFFLSSFPGDLHRCMSHCSTKRAHVHGAKADGVLHHKECLHEGAIFFHTDSHSQLLSFLPATAALDSGCSAPSVRHPEPKS